MQNFEISWHLMKETGTKALSREPVQYTTATQN